MPTGNFAADGRGWYPPGVSASEKLAVLIFLGTVASVLAAGAVILALDLIRLFTGRRGPRRRAWVWARRIVLPLAGLTVACMAYGYFIEPHWLEVTEVRIASPKLAAAARPIRLVHISDLHCDPKVRLEEKIPRVVAGLSPDLIVFAGDAVNSMEGLGNFRRCMKRLSGLAPCYAVLGNWDVWYYSAAKLFSGTGVRVLDAEGVKLELAGAEIWLAGAPAHRGGIDRALAAAPAGAFTILLYHYPDEIHHAAELKVDLYLAGHTHGGQVALPLYGALVTLSSYGKQFERGLHRVGPTHLYVNRGIGMEGGVPRVRFCARPEVTLIELSPGE